MSDLEQHTTTKDGTDILKGKWMVRLKWLVLIAAYGYLAYKIITFDKYPQLLEQWEQLPGSQWKWLVYVLLLLPLNWGIEARKWQLLTVRFEQISYWRAIKAVLAGISTGFFTPNRIGELVGRIVYLEQDHRKAGVTMSVVNSLTQNLTMALVGLPAALAYFYSTKSNLELENESFLLYTLSFLLIAAVFYFYLPKFSRFLSRTNIAKYVADFTAFLSDYSWIELLRIMFISLVRYAVFCLQLYFMLRFFGILLHPSEALIAIPTTYLFVTFSPSFAFSEAAVRGSYAMLFISAYSGDTISIALAGVMIWVVNFVLPMIAGAILLVKTK